MIGRLGFVLLLYGFAFPAAAADLWDVYKMALSRDPTLQIKHNESLSDAEHLPIARSALLPHLDSGFDYSRFKQNSDLSEENSVSNTNTNKSFSINLQQTLFNAPDWINVRAQDYKQQAAYFDYLSALQDLMVITTEAYFNVLKSKDGLVYASAYQANLHKDVVKAKLRFNAGLSKTVDVETAQASYEQSLLNTLDANYQVMSERLELEKITGSPVGFCGLLTLSVASIGIANVMFLIVNERQAEIGLRMTLGARPRDIFMQFLLETSLIIFLGGFIGFLLAWGGFYCFSI